MEMYHNRLTGHATQHFSKATAASIPTIFDKLVEKEAGRKIVSDYIRERGTRNARKLRNICGQPVESVVPPPPYPIRVRKQVVEAGRRSRSTRRSMWIPAKRQNLKKFGHLMVPVRVNAVQAGRRSNSVRRRLVEAEYQSFA